jgi:hypothetical protein
LISEIFPKTKTRGLTTASFQAPQLQAKLPMVGSWLCTGTPLTAVRGRSPDQPLTST